MKFIMKFDKVQAVIKLNLIEAAKFMYFMLTTDSSELRAHTEELAGIFKRGDKDENNNAV